MRVGLISDTHGLLRPEALAALEGSDHILHAGDIGSAAVLEALGRVAPFTAIRGNNDVESWARSLPETTTVTLGGHRIHLVHDVHDLAIDPAAALVRVVMSGHSHRPSSATRDGVLYVNPGSAGPRRFSLPISVGHLEIDGERVEARLQTLVLRP